LLIKRHPRRRPDRRRIAAVLHCIVNLRPHIGLAKQSRSRPAFCSPMAQSGWLRYPARCQSRISSSAALRRHRMRVIDRGESSPASARMIANLRDAGCAPGPALVMSGEPVMAPPGRGLALAIACVPTWDGASLVRESRPLRRDQASCLHRARYSRSRDRGLSSAENLQPPIASSRYDDRP